MGGDDLAIEILKGIRDEIRQTNARLDQTNTRLDQTNTRLDALTTRIDGLEEGLGRRITESELRTATALTELASDIRDLTTLLRTQLDLRPRVERCEREIDALKARL
jgi:chromosome segregation ATPase